MLSAEKAYERRWYTLAVLCMSLVIITIDNSILNVALPHLQEDLDATFSQLQWMVDSYTLVFACLLLTAGSLGDRFDPTLVDGPPQLLVHRVVGIGLQRLPHGEARVLRLVDLARRALGEPVRIGDPARPQSR